MLIAIRGRVEMPAFQRVVRFARLAALISAGWTFLCAALLAGWWAWSGDAYPVSSIVQLLSPDRTYVTAGFGETDWTLKEAVIDWLLAVPAIVPLLVALALLVIFYRWLAVIDKRELEIRPHSD
jgi:hypothetical protein